MAEGEGEHREQTKHEHWRVNYNIAIQKYESVKRQAQLHLCQGHWTHTRCGGTHNRNISFQSGK